MIKRQKTNSRTGKSFSLTATQFLRGIFTHLEIFKVEQAYLARWYGGQLENTVNVYCLSLTNDAVTFSKVLLKKAHSISNPEQQL